MHGPGAAGPWHHVPARGTWDMGRSPCPGPWSCVGRHVSGPGRPQRSTLVPESLRAGMCRGSRARGGSKEGTQTFLCPRPGVQDPREGFSRGSLLSPAWRAPCPCSGGDGRRAARKCELLLPPAGIARQCPWPRSRPQPHKHPPGQGRPAQRLRSPTGTRSGFIVRVGNSCLPGPSVAPTDPAHRHRPGPQST